MENFNWTRFTRKVAINASMASLYDAWTKASEIEKWFLREARYFDSNNTLIDRQTPVEAGNTYEWHWYLYEGIEHGKITEANGKDHLQFTFSGNCKVDIQLTQHEHYVIVELTQKDIPTDDDSKHKIRLGCDTGWSFYLVNLKSMFEGGVDLRNKEASLKNMVNM